jgi:hypothetical protein
MTDKATDVTVTQSDRDAAAEWLRSVHCIYLALWIEGTGEAPEWAESPNPDDYSLVQALARHRTASEQAASGEMERTTIARALHKKACGLLPVSAAGPLEDEWSFWLSLADAALSTTSEAPAQEDQQ